MGLITSSLCSERERLDQLRDSALLRASVTPALAALIIAGQAAARKASTCVATAHPKACAPPHAFG